jgi:high-affinity iron transporter
MLFWMRRTAANIRGELHAGIDRAITDGSLWGLSALAFTAVIREGIETALFLLGQVTAASQAEAGASSTMAGAVVGLGAAGLIGYGFYRGARVLNLRTFFTWTGIALIFIAAGLVANALHELIEVKIIGFGTGIAFDISTLLPHSPESGNLLGQLLHAVLGYSSSPEWTMLVAWIGYLVSVLLLYARPMRPDPPVAQAPEQRPAST